MGSQRVGHNWATFTFTQKIKISCYLKVVIGHSESLHPTLNDTHTGNSRHSGMTMAASHGDIAMCTKTTGPIFDLLWTLRIAPLIQSFHFQMRECSIPQILTINGIWDLVYGLILILGKFCTYYWTKRDPVVLTLILVMKVKVAQLCPALCNPMDYTVHGILQVRILEWVAVPFSRGSPNPGIKPRSPALQVDSLQAEPHGKPKNTGVGSLSLLQQIFPTQELNQGLLHCRRIPYLLSC